MRDLTALEVNALRHKLGTHRVAANLYLKVREARRGGTRASWVFRYERGTADKRKGKHLGLGSMTDFTYAEAKERARRQRQLLADKIDPLEQKRAKETEAKLEAAKAITFGQCAEKLVATHRLSWRNPKHAQQWATVFKGSSRRPAASAAINDLPVQAIDTTLALKVLEPIWTKTPETASRVRQRCEKVIDWATARGFRTGDNPFRWEGHLKELLPSKTKLHKVKHHPALPYAELPSFMAELRQRDGVSARALELTILCATRTNETINATWDNEIDFTDKVWTVPANRMKAGKAHKVPLSDRAIEVLKALPREDGTPYLFLGAAKGKPLSNMAMLELLRRMRPGLTVHGFRSCFMDWAHERAFAKVVIDMALAHKVSDKVEEAYRRGDLFEKRRQLMQTWAAYCEQPPAAETANVVSLGER